MTKWVYNFGRIATDGDASLQDLLGGKGANLAEMGNLGLPVPPGFTISTEACDLFYSNKKKLHKSIIKDIKKELHEFKNQNILIE